MNILRLILFCLMGFVMSSGGLTITTWQYWAVLFIAVAISISSQYES